MHERKKRGEGAKEGENMFELSREGLQCRGEERETPRERGRGRGRD